VAHATIPMHFLNPYMLLTLGIIPILILIHILKPKPRPMDVTNLFLWQAVLQESGRHLVFRRLKRNLPLLLQILIAVLAALALAKPTWTYQTAKKGNIILVIDTSASMQTRSGTVTRFDLARQRALELIDRRDPGQKILIVEAGSKAFVHTGFSDNSSRAKTLVEKLQPSDAPAKLEPAIYLALSFVDPAREDLLYLITDGAGEDFPLLVKNHPKIRPVIVGGQGHNIGITQFEFRQQIDHSDQYEFMLEIRNFDLSAVECSVRLSIDDVVLFDRAVALEAREKKLLIFPYAGLIGGIAAAALDREDDFSPDNRAYLSLNAAKEIWVLLVSQGNPFLEKLLAAYPNFKVNAVKEIIPSSWPEQTARHDIVIVDRMDFPATQRGNLLLIDAYSPSIPVIKTGQVRLPKILAWNRESPLMANVDLSGLIVEQSTILKTDKRLQPLIESSRTALMVAFEEGGLRAVLLDFDLTRSDLPLKVAFPVMMSNIFNWLNPNKLEFSILKTQAGAPFDIYLKPQTDIFYTRAPHGKWEKQTATGNPFRYTQTGRVGVYTVSENDKERYFTVNLTDESESDINAKSPAHLPDQPEPGLVSEEIAVQQPIWTVFILAACALLMAEWYLWLKIK
jgi:Ca-activated chloride channel family protein